MTLDLIDIPFDDDDDDDDDGSNDPFAPASRKISLSLRHRGEATVIDRDDARQLVYRDEVRVDRGSFGTAHIASELLPPALAQKLRDGLRWVRFVLRFNVDDTKHARRKSSPPVAAGPHVDTDQLVSVSIYPYKQQWHDVLLLRRGQSESADKLRERLADCRSIREVIRRCDAYPPSADVLTYDPNDSTKKVVTAAIPAHAWPLRFDDDKQTARGQRYNPEFNSVLCIGVLSPRLLVKKKGKRTDPRFGLPDHAQELYGALVDEVAGHPLITDFIDDFRNGHGPKPTNYANRSERTGDRRTRPATSETGYHEDLLRDNAKMLLRLAREAATRALSGPCCFVSYPTVSEHTGASWKGKPVAEYARALLAKSVQSTDTCLKRPTEKRLRPGERTSTVDPSRMAGMSDTGYAAAPEDDADANESLATRFEHMLDLIRDPDAALVETEDRIEIVGNSLSQLRRDQPDVARKVDAMLTSLEEHAPYAVDRIRRIADEDAG